MSLFKFCTPCAAIGAGVRLCLRILVGIGISCAAFAKEASLASSHAPVCGESIELRAWGLWDDWGRRYLEDQYLERRLLLEKDVFALYDMQLLAHNLVGMAIRCERTARVREFAELFSRAFAFEVSGRSFEENMVWVCFGGRLCGPGAPHRGKEVVLVSAQFLAMLGELAIYLEGRALAEGHEFVARVSSAIESHLGRWITSAAKERLERASESDPADGKPDRLKYALHDTDLWQAALALEYLYLSRSRSDRMWQDKGRMRGEVQRYLSLVGIVIDKRIRIVAEVDESGGRHLNRADVDNGFWQAHPDYRFAGYDGSLPPMNCRAGLSHFDEEARAREFAVAQHRLSSVGWDISHARRLVQFFRIFAAIERRATGGKAQQFLRESADVYVRALSEQLVRVIWNGDLTVPLFANFWSGANGWYRVDYDPGYGRCFAGFMPFGLSDSVPTGGYLEWSYVNPILGLIGVRILSAFDNPDMAGVKQMSRWYPALSGDTAESVRRPFLLMFLPTIVYSR